MNDVFIVIIMYDGEDRDVGMDQKQGKENEFAIWQNYENSLRE